MQQPGAMVLMLDGVLTRSAVASLCARLDATLALDGAPAVVICDVAVLPADLSSLDALARLQLTASRRHAGICLRNAAPGLRGLIALAGLATVLPLEPR